ncbi:MAG TPA: PH domain-containing protein [Verrucomicrobiae bacterium]|jgi:hypothetical protein|nr:PH domain-containing protein [Verrucomicrobiae bacterium]
MYEPLRRWALAILKVPAEPHAPIGDPASLRVFNAGRNYFRLRMARWGMAQLLALGGFIFWTALLVNVERMARGQKEARTNQPAKSTAEAVVQPGQTEGQAATRSRAKRRQQKLWNEAESRIRTAATAPRQPGVEGKTSGKGRHFNGWAGFKQACVEVALLLPSGAFLLIWGLKIFSFLVYVFQIPLTYAVRRLDYEMRWYMVTDRSLRLRHGVWKISEATMSFANIQQVVVSQGPLQRLLGLSDVKVKSAGGGGGGGHYNHQGNDMHSGLFHSVTNAAEIRDLILERLRRFREGGAGLGDPDDKPTTDAHVAAARSALSESSAINADALTAARELATEARALRSALTFRAPEVSAHQSDSL